MKNTVYFMDLRATPRENLFAKLARLMEKAGLSKIFEERDLVAIKLHFGEMGNAAFIRPIYIREIVKQVRERGGSPFLTDANTLYAGTRSDAPSHLTTAIQNGFAYAVTDAPVIIADGLRGKSETAVQINRKRFEKVYIGTEIVQADALISVAHFKGHELSGFGGAIKNMGMGCASRRGKMAQHATLAPKIREEDCVACGDCTRHCAQGAISIPDNAAVIDPDKCIGCGECILICPNRVIEVQWGSQAIPTFLENMVEYTEGVIKGKEDKTLFINFITNISPACDCYGYNDTPIVRDIGIVASRDIVALDQASVDLVNGEHGLPGTCLKNGHKPGEDKFRAMYPAVEWDIQLSYAEKLGLGKREYTLEKI